MNTWPSQKIIVAVSGTSHVCVSSGDEIVLVELMKQDGLWWVAELLLADFIGIFKTPVMSWLLGKPGCYYYCCCQTPYVDSYVETVIYLFIYFTLLYIYIFFSLWCHPELFVMASSSGVCVGEIVGWGCGVFLLGVTAVNCSIDGVVLSYWYLICNQSPSILTRIGTEQYTHTTGESLFMNEWSP